MNEIHGSQPAVSDAIATPITRITCTADHSGRLMASSRRLYLASPQFARVTKDHSA
jgi:hypothetical protein